jgi:YMGG-like Gly-zipper
MKFSFVALLGAAIAATACSDQAAKQARSDSALAQDLALAGTPTAQPTFQDTSVSPAPVKAAPEVKEPPALVRTRTTPPPPKPRPQTISQPAPAPVTTPQILATAPAAAPASERGEIASGSSAELTSTSKVCTTSNMVGDKLAATLDGPITGSHGAELPAGSTVVLEVASVQSGDKAENAQITFRVRSIVVNDKTYNVAADAAPTSALDRTKVQGTDSNADKKKVVGGAIAGAILGQMIGHNTKGTLIGAAAGAAAGAAVSKAGEKWEGCLPAGAHLRLKLNEPLVLM